MYAKRSVRYPGDRSGRGFGVIRHTQGATNSPQYPQTDVPTVRALHAQATPTEPEEHFEALRRCCSKRVAYPAAKIIDMCFFAYGIRLEGGVYEDA